MHYPMALLILLLLPIVVAMQASSSLISPPFACLRPSFYVFGASMVDSGENAVAMPLRSRAEFSPYGMDYFSKPNGRWSNGRTFMDLITQELGYGLLSPFLKSIGSNFTSGVNFACSGSTAQNSTASGDDSGGLFSLLVQVDQFREYQEDIEATHRGSLMVSQLKQHFSDSIFFFETAHNDYIDVAFKTTDFDPLNTVIATISAMRQAFEMHNMHLEKLLGELRIQLPEADWILFDAYSIMLDGYHNPSKYVQEERRIFHLVWLQMLSMSHQV